MATVNLGAIKFNWKGAFVQSNTYAVDDVVSSGGSSYVCILATTNNVITNTTYWNIMSSAGTNGTNGTDLTSTLTTQGDIVYRDGSGLQRLPKGTAGQVLKMNSGATAPEYGTVSSGVPNSSVVNTSQGFFSSSTHSQWLDVTALDTSLTPSATSSKILVLVSIDGAIDTHHYLWNIRVQRKIGSGSFGNVTGLYSPNDNDGSHRSVRAEYDDNGSSTCASFYMDSPNTTSAVTYRIAVYNGSGGGTLYLNRNGSGSDNSSKWQIGAFSKISLIELKA